MPTTGAGIRQDLRAGFLTAAGFLSAVAFGTAIAAGPPIAFDQYNVSNGTITSGANNSDCSGVTVPGAPTATVVCSDVLVDDGMMQRHVAVSGAGALDGDYIQFVVVDPGTSGDPSQNPFTAGRGNLTFTNEDFVKQQNRVGGIASKQTIVEATMNGVIEDRFATAVEYNFGWANGNADPWVLVTQDLSQVDYTNPLSPEEKFSQNFMSENNSPPLNWQANEKVQINQTVDLSNGSGKGVQGFKFAKAVGSYQTTAHTGLANTLDLLVGGFPLDGSPVMLPGGTNGGDPGCQTGETALVNCYDWNAGDELRALWIGQWLENGGSGDTFWGLTRYSAVQPSTQIPYSTQLITSNMPGPAGWAYATNADPVGWAAINTAESFIGFSTGFGPAPGLPTVPSGVPIIVAGTDAAFTTAPATMAATIPTGSASATTTPEAIPLAYNDWHVTGGVFDTVGCSGAGVVCGTPTVNQNGVYQRIVAINGVQYVQTIVTDKTATGDPNAGDFSATALAFKNETFVKVGSTTEGLASNLHLAESDLSYVNNSGPMPTTGGYFTYNTQLKTGAFNGGGTDPRMTVDQRLYAAEGGFPSQVSGVDYDFHLIQGQTQEDKIMYMSDAVGTVTNSSYTGTGSVGTTNYLGDPIMFATARVGGAFQTTTHTDTSGDSNPANDLLPSLGGTGDIGWNPYDTIQVSWIGARYTTADPFGPSLIGTTSYTNLSGDGTNAYRISATSLTNYPPDPETWFAPFSTYTNPTYQQNYVPTF